MKIFIFCALFLLIAQSVKADFFILYDKVSKEIINIADSKSDFQIAESDKSKLDIQKMNGLFLDLELEAPLQDYKMVNGKFILNTKKISDREILSDLNDEIAAEWALIEQEIINMAIDNLTVKGIILKHFPKK